MNNEPEKLVNLFGFQDKMRGQKEWRTLPSIKSTNYV